ncbi:uncharacterized protein LOC109716284 [Ananas comosus]|uniref:Uncharacterized protein LOC109716284 n=1 Tax=Ananas comosus TaxID=4615 RepID=A0A6P5FLN6_ANACO|nr:uncharacterized protein LOC109716284 [Ananas comosus]XP_020097214.1 uncharacterized protein LOC109716284 [Ananas comosus]XP_020097216.1 uncharacterized protein LOC109716284 [Ananas comosus]XP_020097217.1 uncharacterized protein LOC109716284 [Ananas comosus]
MAAAAAEATEANPNPNPRSEGESAPWVEVHLFRRGRGPVGVFRSRLGGAAGDRLDVRGILAEHGLRSLFAFQAPSHRGFPIRFAPADGRSRLPFRPGSVVFLDGDPKDSLAKPIAAIGLGVAVPALLIALMVKGVPEALKRSRSVGGGLFPPWILACMLVLYVRSRRRPAVS